MCIYSSTEWGPQWLGLQLTYFYVFPLWRVPDDCYLGKYLFNKRQWLFFMNENTLKKKEMLRSTVT